MGIDWKQVANQIDCIGPDGIEQQPGTDGGRRALEILVGEENIRDAVDYFVSMEPGAFAAEMVLRIISSKVAMERCYEIYKNERDLQRASGALFLLAEIADDRALPWIQEFFEDENESICWNALMALDHILSGPLGDEGIAFAKSLLARAESDPYQALRERAMTIHQMLAADPHYSYLEL